MQPALPRLPLALALLAGLAAPALAQGTPEQRTACAPDAVRLCPDTIPDIGRTKACMQVHVAELSPACRTVLLRATGAPPALSPRRRVARVAPAPAAPARAAQAPAPAAPAAAAPILPAVVLPGLPPADFGALHIALPDADAIHAQTVRNARDARAVVARLCRQSVLDPNTCAFTNSMIDLAR